MFLMNVILGQLEFWDNLNFGTGQVEGQVLIFLV